MTFRGSLLLFGDDFDAPAPSRPPAPAAEPPPPPPSYDQAQFDAARAEGLAEGHAKGLADAAAADAARIAATLATIGEHLGEAAASAARIADDGAQAIARLVLSAVVAGYPLLGKRFGADELCALLREILPGLLLEPRVTLCVHPSMVSAVTGALAGVPHSERRHMTIEPTEAIPPGDARITWPHGAAIRDTVATAAAIADILRPLGLLPEPDPACTDAEQR